MTEHHSPQGRLDLADRLAHAADPPPSAPAVLSRDEAIAAWGTGPAAEEALAVLASEGMPTG